MKIGLCSDHAGFEYKTRLAKYLSKRGFETVDYGTFSTESCDYPDFAARLAKGVQEGEVEKGIAFCGTGNGMAMSLNKHKGIRAGLAWNKAIASLVKRHNNANVLVMPARFVTFYTATAMVREWMDAEFEGGRHQGRIDKLPL